MDKLAKMDTNDGAQNGVDERSRKGHFREKDKGYAWMVVIAAFCTNMISASLFTGNIQVIYR